MYYLKQFDLKTPLQVLLKKYSNETNACELS